MGLSLNPFRTNDPMLDVGPNFEFNIPRPPAGARPAVDVSGLVNSQQQLNLPQGGAAQQGGVSQSVLNNLISALVGGGQQAPGGGGGGIVGNIFNQAAGQVAGQGAGGAQFAAPNPFGTPIRNVEARLRQLAGQPISAERPPIGDFGGQQATFAPPVPQPQAAAPAPELPPAIANNPFIDFLGLGPAGGAGPVNIPAGQPGVSGFGPPAAIGDAIAAGFGGGQDQGGAPITGGQGFAAIDDGGLQFDPGAIPSAGLGLGSNIAAFAFSPALAALAAMLGITSSTLAGRSTSTARTRPGSQSFTQAFPASPTDFSGVPGLVDGVPGGSSFFF